MTQSHADRPLLGILLMLGFCVLIPFSDALAKLLGGVFPLLQLIIIRFVAQAGLLLPLALARGAVIFPSARVVRLALVRTLLQIGGISLMFSALRFLPLADAVAIAFVMPFIMLILGRYILHEEVGPRRLAACAVGFVGTMMVVQPSFAAVGWPALLPLAVAVIFAFFMLVTRQIAKEIDPIALQGLGGILGLPILVPLLLLPELGGTPPLIGWTPPPDAGALWLLVALGITGTLGHLLMTWSLRFAPSATLAPMQYLEIPVAAVVGLAIFGEFPNGLALIGIAVTIASGLYIVVRERNLSRAAARVATPAPPAG
ncbi:DMT family transporter [Roseicyclus mahoneyensis]|uniref:EamA-like transporter family protein n=1 Tax=Roseicyclus mahoneyensis TaxID=164332 RepID=A0A316GK11_9RHOB|nr:DMT family transporter [Roseicyclus mahoneyensis]PWK60885.1 EamA-like transporter family protein [Roseicyclus mahoneyensis]